MIASHMADPSVEIKCRLVHAKTEKSLYRSAVPPAKVLGRISLQPHLASGLQIGAQMAYMRSRALR
jgi:hypothetical protein